MGSCPLNRNSFELNRYIRYSIQPPRNSKVEGHRSCLSAISPSGVNRFSFSSVSCVGTPDIYECSHLNGHCSMLLKGTKQRSPRLKAEYWTLYCHSQPVNIISFRWKVHSIICSIYVPTKQVETLETVVFNINISTTSGFWTGCAHLSFLVLLTHKKGSLRVSPPISL